MIRIEQLAKSFGSLAAVQEVSLQVEGGETFGLLGPNGAGKTTTIHMLVGAIAPDSGRIELNGKTDPSQSEVRRQIGVAPQALSLYGDLTAEENLSFFGRLYGLRGGTLTERVERALVFSGLTDRRKDRVGVYSGGMKRRLNLACALLHDPPILLLDEPTVGVDPQSRNHILEQIETLAREGRTILYTTHYMEEAQRLCKRVAIMDQGRILAVDTVERLLAEHGGPAVVEAVLAAPANGKLPPSARVEGDEVRFESVRPFEEIARLTLAGVQFSSLKVERPDLEAVFLRLTGRRLRD